MEMAQLTQIILVLLTRMILLPGTLNVTNFHGMFQLEGGNGNLTKI